MAAIIEGKKNIYAFNTSNTSDAITIVDGNKIPYGMLVYFLKLQSCTAYSHVRLYTLVNSVYNELIANTHISSSNILTSVNSTLTFPDGLYFPPKSDIYALAGDSNSAYSVSIYAYGLTKDD